MPARSAVAVLAVLAALLLAAAADGATLRERRDAVEQRLHDVRGLIRGADVRERRLSDGIAAQSARISRLQGRVDVLAAEVSRLEAELAAARERLHRTRARLAEQRRRLVVLAGQLRAAERRLADRLVETYKTEGADALVVVLGAEDFRGLVDGVEVLSRVTGVDAGIAADVDRARRALAEARRRTAALAAQQAREEAELTDRTARRRAAHDALVVRRDRLAAMRARRQAALDALVVKRSEWRAEADGLAAASDRLGREIRAAERRAAEAAAAAAAAAAQAEAAAPAPAPASGPTAAPSSSGFIWPVHGPVVSPFGVRWGRMHEGIDIAVPAGTPIAAAAAGSVAYAGWMGGYGQMVVVQHPSGLATAYAHMSAIAVSTGQSVAQGQALGAVGCTGHCFGDHLHFEVRRGGSPVDPLGYL